MILNEDLFEIDIPIVNPEPELTIDEIEQPTVATPEENGVATMLINSISDTWDKINEYNGIISTVSVTNVDNADEIISVVKDVVDTENENVGKLMSALRSISPNTENVRVGEEEADMKLTEALDPKKVELISDILGRSISSSEENEIYDNWRAFYDDPETYRDTAVVELVNKGLDSLDKKDDSSFDVEDDDFEVDSSDDDIDTSEDDFEIEESKKMTENVHRIGTDEYDANEGRRKRIAQYRRLAHVDEGVRLTEDMIDDWALSRTACFNNRSKDQVKSEILGRPWSEFEEN